MAYAMRQITDSVHETIYLSDLESELVSTPYFFRLHDIYQSSTVYMTFPSNRTKRYEHCLGTMQIASDMLFAAISNADASVLDSLFDHLSGSFAEIVRAIFVDSNRRAAQYYTRCGDSLDDAVDPETQHIIDGGHFETLLDRVVELIEDGQKDGCLADCALDHYQIHPRIEDSDASAHLRVFLYKALLEAVRVIALFHDVGHPPYSHVIEKVLGRLYDEIHIYDEDDKAEEKRAFRETLNCEKVSRLEQRLGQFKGADGGSGELSCRMLLDGDYRVPNQLHERIGITFLHAALEGVVVQRAKSIAASGKESHCRLTELLFDICVFEFAIAIEEEKTVTFRSLHSVVDGIVDADRLDYVSRDAANSGMKEGGVPYRRLIDSVRLIDAKAARMAQSSASAPHSVEDGFFALAFPSKVASEIFDFLIKRYKVFARINWHHRSMRTASTLQQAVYRLALDYLKGDDSDTGTGCCINPDIRVLWDALGYQIGSKEMRIIQWNDSWLISTLHGSLVKLKEQRSLDESQKRILGDLEEILLNRRKFTALIKRDEDMREFAKRIFARMDLTEDDFEQQRIHELGKLLRGTNGVPFGSAQREEGGSRERGQGVDEFVNNPVSDAEQSVRHLANLKKALATGDLQLLDAMSITGDLSLVELVNQELKKMTESVDGKPARISDYSVLANDDRDKIGIPRKETAYTSIYLYDAFGYFLCDTSLSLVPRLEALRVTVPWLLIYIATPQGDVADKQLLDDVMDSLAAKIGDSLRKRYDKLYRRSDDEKVA